MINCVCLLHVWFSCDELGTDQGCPSSAGGTMVVMADWFRVSRFGLQESSSPLASPCELANFNPPVGVGLESSGCFPAMLSVRGATNRLAPVCFLFVELWPALADSNSTLSRA